RGVDAPILGMGARVANGALGILELRRMMVLRSKAIADDDARDAVAIEPARDLLALMIHGQIAIAAAGEDNDGGAAGFVLSGQEGHDGGGVRGLAAFGARSAFGPERNERRLVGLGVLGRG